MFDTHCHLTSSKFDGRVTDVIADANAAGVHGMITVATTSTDAEAALALAEHHACVWCSAGVHPLYADEPTSTGRDWDALRRVAAHDRCVAFGELGLDNYYDTPLRSVQDALLEEQLAFVESCHREGIRKPVIVHCREAFDDLLPIFAASSLPADGFVFHCFTGNEDDAQRVLDFGAMISLTGVVTFANARDVAAASDLIPLDRMMIETDAPYLSPEPVRKVFPNEPKHVPHTAAYLADRRSMPVAEFCGVMDANARRFFALDDSDVLSDD